MSWDILHDMATDHLYTQCQHITYISGVFSWWMGYHYHYITHHMGHHHLRWFITTSDLLQWHRVLITYDYPDDSNDLIDDISCINHHPNTKNTTILKPCAYFMGHTLAKMPGLSQLPNRMSLISYDLYARWWVHCAPETGKGDYQSLSSKWAHIQYIP